MNHDRSGIECWAWIPAVQEKPEFFDGNAPARGIGFVRRHRVRALLWTYEKEGLPLVEAIHSATGVPVCPIVPNMATYARDTRDKGFVRAALDRLLALPPADMARVCLGAVPAVADVLRKDFATGVCILAEMELARFRRFGPVAAFLNNQMADLAMAFDNARLFAQFIHLARGRYGLGAGFATCNLGHLAPKLRSWGLAPDHIVAPFNPKGYLMHPSQAACEACARDLASSLIASTSNAGKTISPPDAEEYLLTMGIVRRVIEWDES